MSVIEECKSKQSILLLLKCIFKYILQLSSWKTRVSSRFMALYLLNYDEACTSEKSGWLSPLQLPCVTCVC